MARSTESGVVGRGVVGRGAVRLDASASATSSSSNELDLTSMASISVCWPPSSGTSSRSNPAPVSNPSMANEVSAASLVAPSSLSRAAPMSTTRASGSSAPSPVPSPPRVGSDSSGPKPSGSSAPGSLDSPSSVTSALLLSHSQPNHRFDLLNQTRASRRKIARRLRGDPVPTGLVTPTAWDHRVGILNGQVSFSCSSTAALPYCLRSSTLTS